MSKIKVLNQKGEEIKEKSLPSNFELKVSDLTLARYINYIRAKKRQAIAQTKDRGAVSGGGKKPWRQKGTGRARVGSSRSPLWIHGGVTFGPTTDRNFALKMTQKSRHNARQTIFNHYFSQKRIKIIDNIEIKSGKTRDAENLINNLNLEGKIALFLAKSEINNARTFRNLPYIILNSKDNMDVLNLIDCDWLMFSSKAFEEIWPVKEKNDKLN